MTLEEIEQGSYRSANTSFLQGNRRKDVYIYFPVKGRDFYEADIVEKDNDSGQVYSVTQPAIKGDTLFEIVFSLTLEHLIPVRKLDWKGSMV